MGIIGKRREMRGPWTDCIGLDLIMTVDPRKGKFIPARTRHTPVQISSGKLGKA
jgi:hypothetical protein